MFKSCFGPCPGALLCLGLIFTSVACDDGQPPSPSSTDQPTAPPLAFVETAVPGLSIAAENPEQVTCRELPVEPGLGEEVKLLSPPMLIEPAAGADPPRAVRFRLPADCEVHDPARLALAFNELGYCQSTGRVRANWHVHAADYDANTRTVTARVGHASVWVCVEPGTTRKSVETDRFRIHYWPGRVSSDDVLAVGQALVEARRRLEALRLDFGWKPDERLDVYMGPIPAGDRGVVYAEHQLGKAGGRFITVNTPKNIPDFSRREMRVSVAHELFHELQCRYQNISTLKDIWAGGAQKFSTSWLNPAGKLIDTIYPLEKYDYPFGWMNEALSTWFQLDFDPAWQPAGDDPLYGNAGDFLTGGLGGLRTDNGYGGAAFVDYMVSRCGREFIRELLLAAKAQGRKRDPLAAIKEAALKIAVLKQQPELATFDPLWSEFATTLLLEDAKHFDPRVNRKVIVPTLKQAQNVPLGQTPVTVELAVRVAPLSMMMSSFRLTPTNRPTPEVNVLCTITQTVGDDTPFSVVTYPIGTPPKMGERSVATSGCRYGPALSAEEPKQQITLPLPQGQRHGMLRLVTVGIWSGSAPAAADRATARYKLTFSVEPVEDEQPEADDEEPAKPTDNVITGVYGGQLQSNTRRSGELVWIVDAKDRFVLPNHYEVLSEKKNDFGRVEQTTFRFRRGFGSPPIPPGRYYIGAGPRPGKYYAKSKPFTLGTSTKANVSVGATPPDSGGD